MPLTNNVIIDQANALDLIDQLRVAVPEEVRQAKRINGETERIVERAQEEAERILARAQEQAAFLIEERELTRARAEIESRRIIAEGQREARRSVAARTTTPQSVLVRLEGECVKALQSIRRGLALLDERQPLRRPRDGRDGRGPGASRSDACSAITSPTCCARRPAPSAIPDRRRRLRDRRRPQAGGADRGRGAAVAHRPQHPCARGRRGRVRGLLQPLPRAGRGAGRRRHRGRGAAVDRHRHRPAARRADEPDALRLDDHHELDLGEPMREAISLAEPIAPLCRPDCAGCAVICGADLNADPDARPRR